MNELSHNEFKAIEDFATDLIQCFNQRKIQLDDKVADMVFDYVLNVIRIHLNLKELDLKRYEMNMANYFGER